MTTCFLLINEDKKHENERLIYSRIAQKSLNDI
jgi:hypothetical protein